MSGADLAGAPPGRVAAPAQAPLEGRLAANGGELADSLQLEAFLDHVAERGLEMYPAQEEAVLEVFAGNSVVLDTPTGSGKSLVALAACFQALASGRTAFYTAPIKALVAEKFFELCGALGPRNVGLLTGDASVNRDAPILCCTAEILAHQALREGEETSADWVVMDEFHYYADRERGVAWQIPLLTLPKSRFLLMSATLGNPEFFVQQIERLTSAPAALVRSRDRPVPLDWHFSEKPLHETIFELVSADKAPVYVVHFSQRAASEEAQNLTSQNFTSREEKRRLREALAGFRFDSPFGRELSRFIPHGIGVHHAGMLPKYRRLVERLAQTGLLRVICGTDTLGVGVNVPIRTVLFTQLCKFDGQRVRILSVRDFHQIAGRAGRRGFDTQGSVVVQAPEHEIENQRLRARAVDNPKKLKKLRLKRPPERGYKPWSRATMEELIESPPEPLRSSVALSHSHLLHVLARPGGRGCQVGRALIRRCHESESRKRVLMRSTMELFGSLVSTGIVRVQDRRAFVDADLQVDFSLNQALSLYAVEALSALDPEEPGHELRVLSVVEATLDNPGSILARQVSELKTRLVAELKADGVEYEQRMEALEKVEYPKPEAELIYETFNVFARHHPWVSGHTIAPKSIAREMHEQVLSFKDYVKEYGLARSEGVLLRYLTDVYRALCRTVPERQKTEGVLDLEEWLGAEIRQVDASLLEEWERLEDASPDEAQSEPADTVREPDDVTRNERAFLVMIRNGCFRLVQAIARRDWTRMSELLGDLEGDDTDPAPTPATRRWTPRHLELLMSPYFAEHDELDTGADARGAARLVVERSEAQWRVRQVLSDPDENHDFSIVFEVSLDACRERGRLVMRLLGLASIDSPID